MLYSMTGIGRAQVRYRDLVIESMIKSFNHKYFEFNLSLPPGLNEIEFEIIDELKKKIKRGKIILNLSIKKDDLPFMLDIRSVKHFREAVDKMSRQAGIKNDLTMSFILSYMTGSKMPVRLDPAVKKQTLRAVQASLAELVRYREKEGGVLSKNLFKKVERIHRLSVIIKKRFASIGDSLKDKYMSNISSYNKNAKVDRDRVITEAAILMDRMNIDEETVRLENHCSHLAGLFSNRTSGGKEIDFFAQELLREANTIASKVSDFKIKVSIIEVKKLVEEIREQAQNLE